MHRVFVPSLPESGTAIVTGEDARHIAFSLRMRPGEPVVLCDGRGLEAAGEIEHIDGQSVTVQLAPPHPCGSEPPVAVTVFQCLPKGDKMDAIVQKAVELGAAAVVPVLSSRCVSRPDSKSLAKKRERWQRIAREAAMQSGRGVLPTVGECLPLPAVADRLHEFDTAFFLYEKGGAPLPALLPTAGRRICCLVGPEGGFCEEEAALLRDAGAHVATLGPRILRTETASGCFLAAAMYACGGMGTREM